MTKDEFRDIFLKVLEAAALVAEGKLGHSIPRTFSVELHAPKYPGQTVTAEVAFDAIFLGNDRFYRIIDVAVKEVSSARTLVFMRVSGHQPAEWQKTWNAEDLGPFKQVVANEIRVKE